MCAARLELDQPRDMNVAERGAIEDVGFLAGSKRGASSLVSFLAVAVDLMAGGRDWEERSKHLGKRDAWVFVAW